VERGAGCAVFEVACEKRLLRLGKLAIQGERNPPASTRAGRPQRFDSFSCDLCPSAERRDEAGEEAESTSFFELTSFQ
jgi:hypothetical protein